MSSNTSPDHRRSADAARPKLKAESEMDELTHLIDGEQVANDQWFHAANPPTQHAPGEEWPHSHGRAVLSEQPTDEPVHGETTDMGKPVTQCRERDLPRSVANF